MVFVLDTNIIQEDYRLRSGRFQIFVDYLQKTADGVVMPQLVYKELIANFKRSLGAEVNAYSRSRGKLLGLAAELEIPAIDLDLEVEASLYGEFVLNELRGPGPSGVFSYRESYLEDAVSRAVSRRKPCSGSGKELRDAILWSSVKDIAREHDRVVFISKNTRDFARGDTLHPDLAEEVTKEELDIDYVPSLELWVQRYAGAIDFATEDWLLETVDIVGILQEAAIIWSRVLSGHLLEDGYIERQSQFAVTRESILVDQFYVYPMRDGSYVMDVALEIAVDSEFVIGRWSPESSRAEISLEGSAPERRGGYPWESIQYREAAVVLDILASSERAIEKCTVTRASFR